MIPWLLIGANHRHIVNRSMKPIGFECFIGGGKACRKDQQSIFKKYRKDDQKIHIPLWKEAYFASADKAKLCSTKQCLVSKNIINLRDPKTRRHHYWTIHPIIVVNKTIIKGNSIGALCMNCNIVISVKRWTLPKNKFKFNLNLIKEWGELSSSTSKKFI